MGEVGIAEQAGGYSYLSVADLVAPSHRPAVVIAKTRGGSRERWHVIPLTTRALATAGLKLETLHDGIGDLAAFVATGGESIAVDGDVKISRLKRGIFDQAFRTELAKRDQPSSLVGRYASRPGTSNDLQSHPDAALGRATANPYNEFLEWLFRTRRWARDEAASVRFVPVAVGSPGLRSAPPGIRCAGPSSKRSGISTTTAGARSFGLLRPLHTRCRGRAGTECSRVRSRRS